MPGLLRRAAPPGPDGSTVRVTPADAGWEYIHFSAYRGAPGWRLNGQTEDRETALIVLTGRARITAGGQDWGEVGARDSVFAPQPPHTLLLPPGTEYRVQAVSDLGLAVAAAPAPAGQHPARLIRPEDVVVEHRGQGVTARTVRHILPENSPASRLLLVEVITPAGNWSSYPPHKHDTNHLPEETYLEETYYYQFKPEPGYAVQRVYTGDATLAEAVAPHHGDLVLVPRGYHPVAAAPGYDCYYLNAMAGPVRKWAFRPDPAHAWLMNWTKPAGISS